MCLQHYGFGGAPNLAKECKTGYRWLIGLDLRCKFTFKTVSFTKAVFKCSGQVPQLLNSSASCFLTVLLNKKSAYDMPELFHNLSLVFSSFGKFDRYCSCKLYPYKKKSFYLGLRLRKAILKSISNVNMFSTNSFS